MREKRHRARPARGALASACALVLVVPAAVGAPPATAAWDDDPAVDARVEQLLDQMTPAEKADLATGELNNDYGFYDNGVPRLGIPALRMADGPVGVRIANPAVNGQRSTEMPSASALGATFSTDVAAQYGDLLGREAFATDHNVLLAPSVDVARDPRWGRAFEGFGEDPLLNGTLGSAYVAAVQRRPLIATVKHFVAYNQETDRFRVSAQVDDRTLHEVYGRPFEQAVATARPGAAMCAFNRVNEVFACENPLMSSLLKGEYGFRGFVMSDYNATPSTARAANAGLDQEQPGDQGPGTANFGDRLLAAVAAGDVSQARLDDMARRILRPMVGLGLLDSHPSVQPLPEREDGAVARSIAAQAMVLLKDDRRALPLAPDTPGRIAVIGPDADNASAQGGGSSVVRPTYTVSPLEGITARAARAGATVTYAAGTDGISEGDLLPGPPPVPSTVLRPEGGAPGDRGLRVTYWSNDSFSGDPHRTQVEPNANDNFGFYNFPGFNAASPKVPTARGDFGLTGDLSARWTGTLTAPATADYRLGLTARGDATLWIDGDLFVQHSGELSSVSRAVRLTAGVPHTVRVDYAAPAANTYQGGQVRFFWQHPEEVQTPAMRDAVADARAADAAVVVVRDYESEGPSDRPSLDLPKEQGQLIRAVARANPRTVVVVETGAPVTTASWEGDVRAIVQAWYPGQEQGNAIADVLFGDVNPSGKLPVTVPADESQTPTSAPEQFPGVGLLAQFSEGVFVGYRGYQQRGLPTQYPFGHGLSYTEFRYRALRVRSGPRRLPQGDVPVTFTLRNAGARTGSEVAQVYVGRLPTRFVATPPRQLAAFTRVTLAPGERQRVTVTVPRRALSYWDTGSQHWVTPAGRVPVYVGGDSEDAALAGVIRVH